MKIRYIGERYGVVAGKALFPGEVSEDINPKIAEKLIQDRPDDFEIVGAEDRAESLEVSASDAAVKLAAEHGIDLATIEGTGKDGSIVKKDVEIAITALATSEDGPAKGEPSDEAPAE